MFNSFIVIALAVFASLPIQAQAEELPNGATLIQLNSRTFDLRTDVRNLRRGPDFIPLTEIKWLSDLVDRDPYLEQTVLHIQARTQPISMTWPSVTPDKAYPLTENIPEFMAVEGFQTRSSHPKNFSFILLPIDNPSDFYVSCSGSETDKSSFCAVLVAYPPDSEIRLMARVYNAKPPFNFREIANRMREIAYCLDVTDRLSADGASPEALVDHKIDKPDLRDCHELVS
ncbi:MAG: hypothetical protein ACJA2X_001185 [Halocynthiibacter sp.]|jgi:hypothetical protein